MANRSLAPGEITRLVAITDRQAHAADARSKWPGRENSRLLAQAVKNRLPSVKFNDGRVFKIRYTKHFGGSVFVSPDDSSFTPCGYFSIDKLEKSLDAIEGLEEYVD